MEGTRLRRRLSLGSMDASGDTEEVYHAATRSDPESQAVLIDRPLSDTCSAIAGPGTISTAKDLVDFCCSK